MAVVTFIDLAAGGAPVHVTVDDQLATPLADADIAWASLAGVTIAPDVVGFLFSAEAFAAPGTGFTTKATYSGARASLPVVGPVLTVNILPPPPPPVTALQYTSP